MTDFKRDLKALLRCMIVMALADGKLREQEIDVVVAVYQKLVGQPIERSIVRELFEQLPRGEPSQILANTAALESLDTRTKRLIVKACYLVKVSDCEVAEVELATLATIAAALNFSEDQLVEVLREVSSEQFST